MARYGGDEFVMFVPEKDERGARQLAERLRERIGRETTSRSAVVTSSFGIASYPEDGTDPDDLIDKADRAMYCAKQKGRDRIESYAETM